MWFLDGNFLIRWESQAPSAGAYLEYGFKWDTGDENKSAERKAFLKEVLLLALPFILKSTIESRAIATWDLDVNLGFTYPLSFGGQARKRLIESHESISEDLKELTGFSFRLHSIDESSACVNLLGGFNSSDTLLVADMGGGSLDLALFTGLKNGAHQIGSVRFAGETCLKVLAEKRNIDLQEIRDRIAQGKCHKKFGGDQVAVDTLHQFTGIAFEFLRTMIEAYRKGKPDKDIHMVLAGNGWHLVEAFSSQTENSGAKKVFNKHYNDLVELLNDKRINVQDPVQSLRSNKHLVAIGALKQAQAGGYQLDPSKSAESKLPAGRGVKFINKNDENNLLAQLQWSDLVGEGVNISESPLSVDLSEENLHVDFDDMPPLGKEWQAFFLRLFRVTNVRDIPKPAINLLRGKLRESITKGISQQFMKGPLQIILEYYWIEEMKKIK